jgi:hypothetical protein
MLAAKKGFSQAEYYSCLHNISADASDISKVDIS